MAVSSPLGCLDLAIATLKRGQGAALFGAALIVATLPVRAATPAPRLIDSVPMNVPTPPMPASVGRILFHEDFEKGVARWAISGGASGVVWRRLQAAVCGGAYTMHVGKPRIGLFNDVATTTTLTLRKPIAIGKAIRPLMLFDVRGQAEPAAALVCRVEARRPNGKWQLLGEAIPARYPRVATRYVDLAAFRGGAVELRFAVTAKPFEKPAEGFFLDDLLVLDSKLSPAELL